MDSALADEGVVGRGVLHALREDGGCSGKTNHSPAIFEIHGGTAELETLSDQVSVSQNFTNCSQSECLSV